MFVDTFIRRPILASVCSLVLILAGAVAIPTMPVAQYPSLAPPQVNVTAVYTGANAQEVETAVTTPLEQAINGVEGMLYMSSSSTNSGISTITITFDITRDQDVAAVDVQNRVNQTLGRMPTEVRTTGITVQKQSTGFIMAVGVFSEKGEYDSLFLSNYLDIFIKDAVKRVPGVADVIIFGERKYSMRLWIDPDRLAARGLTANDVVQALREQNVQVAAGSLGQAPAPAGQMYQLSVRALGRLTEASEFENIIIKSGRGRLAGARQGRRTRRARRRDLWREPALRRRRSRRVRCHAASDRQLARDRTRGDRGARSAREVVPAGRALPGLVQHHRRRRSVHRRGAEDAGRGDHPRRARHLRLPADVAQHAHPGDHDPGLAHRRVRVRQADGLFDQHADALRHHPRDRHRRRRRDCRHREHRAPHPGIQGVGAQGRVRRHARGARRRRRDRPRPHRRVRAGRILPGNDRPSLRPVLDHDCLRRGAVGVQRGDADAGAVGAAC